MPGLVALLLMLQVGIVVWAISDIRKPEREVLDDNNRTWVLVVLFGNVIGPLAYVLIGRTFERIERQ